jgi:hypothetical protein
VTPNITYSVFSLLTANLDSLASTTRRRSIGQQLSFAAALQADEPTDAALNGLSAGQEAMVGKDGGLSVAQSFGDPVAFFRPKHDSTERVVMGNVLDTRQEATRQVEGRKT